MRAFYELARFHRIEPVYRVFYSHACGQIAWGVNAHECEKDRVATTLDIAPHGIYDRNINGVSPTTDQMRDDHPDDGSIIAASPDAEENADEALEYWARL